MEQRGRCTEYKSREEIRRQIESINKKYKITGRTGANAGGVQKACGLYQQQAPESGGAAGQLSEAAAGPAKTEEKENESEKGTETATHNTTEDLDPGQG
jgi:hypothetical protein